MKIIGNMIWLIFGGLETALEYFVGSIGIMIMITVTGIPFGRKQFHLAGLALSLFEKRVVSK
jgi:uncharacterized membrane protein YccF (DUF307 family)